MPQLSVKGGLKFVGVDDEQLYKTPKNTFLPRVGFAYQLGSNTVLRGGVGLFAGFLGERRGDVITSGYSQTTTIGTTFNANGAPIPVNWDNALLTQPILEPVGNAQGRQTFLGQGITFFNPEPAVSKQLRWQIGAQHQLPGNWTVEAVYVGNYGYDIEITRNINALPAQYLNTDNARTAAMVANNTFLSATVANPFAGLLPGTQFQQRDDRAPAADAPVPGVRRHQHDEQRRQVVVQLRPVRPAEAVQRRATRSACPTPGRTGSRRPST